MSEREREEVEFATRWDQPDSHCASIRIMYVACTVLIAFPPPLLFPRSFNCEKVNAFLLLPTGAFFQPSKICNW